MNQVVSNCRATTRVSQRVHAAKRFNLFSTGLSASLVGAPCLSLSGARLERIHIEAHPSLMVMRDSSAARTDAELSTIAPTMRWRSPSCTHGMRSASTHGAADGSNGRRAT
jgi:hypothetical protein